MIGYHLLRKNHRVYFLLLASLFFFAWSEPRYVFVLLLSITVNYVFGLLIHITLEKNSYLSKAMLVAAIAGNLGILFYFKYLNATLSNLHRFLGADYAIHAIALPIGISFFTFKGISYIVDLYKKRVSVQKNPALVAFYLSFFPQLAAGPIVRYADIQAQLSAEKRVVSVDHFVNGAKRFIVGLAKKAILADTLGYTADQIFANPALENTASTAWLGILCYAFQIYMDFSGYSDMAIGAGGMLGFRTPENFNYPYIARSLSDFWRRWHITLSTWFRDYVYAPLSTRLVKKRWGLRSIYIVSTLGVWFLTGLWHGGSVNFLLWGLWHGLFLLIERAADTHMPRTKALAPLKYALTMLIVTVGWVFFRESELREAFQYIGVMFGLVQPQNVGFTVFYFLDARVICALVAAAVVSLPIAKTKCFIDFQQRTLWKCASVGLTLILFFVCIVFVAASSYNPFIYFKF